MAWGGKRGNKKKMWNRKGGAAGAGGGAKNKDKNIQSDSKNENEWKLVTKLSNYNMEAYYAYQGLHSQRRTDTTAATTTTDTTATDAFVECTTDIEKNQERQKFLDSMATRLSASFRIGQHMDEELTQKLIQDVEGFAGQEIELLIDEDGKSVNKRELNYNQNNSNDDDKDDKDKDKDKDDNEEKNTTAKNNGDEKIESENADTPDATTTTTTTTNSTEESNTNIDTNNNPPKTYLQKLAPAKTIPYIPYAYQLSVDRRTIRRNPALTNFHEWLKVQQNAGFITRQETVSMIPPVVLAPQSHHAVLDMCAAPGSKTSQLLEVISKIPNDDDSLEPTGFVVANDSDAKRAYMLVHQLRRLNSPAVFITACDGQFFPQIFKGNPNTIITDAEKAQEGLFDRVLCDVPCTGDGTARKNPGIWKRWLASNGHALHPLQVNIGVNGARLTKVGGYMCYSTCSLNPIENEAVVAEILRVTDGSLELVDKRGDMDGFVARSGWTSWKVMTEAQTRKEKRVQNKKRGDNMRKRKKELEKEKELKEQEGQEEQQDDIVKSDDDDKKEDDDDDEKSNKDTTPSSNPTEQEKKDDWIPIPPSWDEETLRKRAEARGLKVFDTIDDVTNHKHVMRSMFPPTKKGSGEIQS